MSRLVGSVLQIIGFGSVTVGGFLLSPVVGWFVGGASLIVTGFALERE